METTRSTKLSPSAPSPPPTSGTSTAHLYWTGDETHVAILQFFDKKVLVTDLMVYSRRFWEDMSAADEIKSRKKDLKSFF